MKKLLLFILLIVSFEINAQDIHFTQYEILQTYFNPANTGDFKGDYRVSAIHRNQWRQVSKPYSTFGLGFEKSGFKFIKKLSVGFHLLNDVAGTSNFTTNRFALNLAYRIPLLDSAHELTIGFSPEFLQQSVNLNNLAFGGQFINNSFNTNNPNGEPSANFSGAKPNFSGGINYKILLGKNHFLKLGGGYFNFTNPEVIDGNASTFSNRLMASLGYQFPLSSRWLIYPNLFYTQQGNYRETLGGINAEWILRNGKFNYQSLLFGVVTRWQDAIAASIGLRYQSWQFGFAYDVNTSAFNTATNYRGAYEIGLVYIFNVFSEGHRKFKHCPTFI